jgi:2-amino-4-hydroxy-6-hydroxymethyldihydropteridine diphosphokinase
MKTRIALALGSNLGDRQAALKAAVAGLKDFATVLAVSPVYETAPAYVTDQPAFLNAALIAETELTPSALLQALKKLESDIGRQPGLRYGPRIVDIDILFYGDQKFASAELHIPHPRMTEREFVLRPLADIALDWLHPISGQTVADMLAHVPKSALPKRMGPL